MDQVQPHSNPTSARVRTRSARFARRADLRRRTSADNGEPCLALTTKGTLVLASGESGGRWIGPVGRIIRALLLSPFVSQKLANFTMKPNSKDLQTLKELIEAGKVTPVIDRTHSLTRSPRPSGTWKKDTPRARSSSRCDGRFRPATVSDATPCSLVAPTDHLPTY